MVGSVKFKEGKFAHTEAILHDDGEWFHENELFMLLLNTNYAPNDCGPACMPYGYCALDLVADEFEGKANHPDPLTPLPPNVIS